MNARPLILLLFMLPLTVAAQLATEHPDARSAAMGGCRIMDTGSTVNVDVGWRQGFMLKGMASRDIAFAVPLGEHGRAGLHYSGFGDADYNEQQATAGYSIAIAPWINIMVYGIYSRIGTLDAHYEPQAWLDAGGGVSLGNNKVCGYISAGSSSWSNRNIWRLHAGINYHPNRQILTAISISRDESLRLRGGIEYTYNGHIFTRAGLCTNPMVLTFGVGYRQQHYHIDIATEAHSTLGLSPMITIGLCL